STSADLLAMSINGLSGSSFNYFLPPRTSAQLATGGGNQPVQVGSARVFPSTEAPESVAILSYRPFGVTVSAAGVTGSSKGTAFDIYAEGAGTAPQPGSVQSGFALANPSNDTVTVRVALTRMDGSNNGLPSAMFIDVPPGGQVTRFLNQVFQAGL